MIMMRPDIADNIDPLPGVENETQGNMHAVAQRLTKPGQLDPHMGCAEIQILLRFHTERFQLQLASIPGIEHDPATGCDRCLYPQQVDGTSSIILNTEFQDRTRTIPGLNQDMIDIDLEAEFRMGANSRREQRNKDKNH